jgi:hypothetical protein
MSIYNEYTTKKGCFNCDKFKVCPFIKIERINGRNFTNIMDDNDMAVPYVYGCACSDYQTHKKERVDFT